MQTAAAKATSAGRARPDTRLLSGADEAALVGEDHGLSAVAHRELHQHAADVRLDRLLRDDQVGGNLRVGHTARAGTLPAATRPSVDLACVAQKLQCSYDDAALHPLHPVIAGPAA